MEHLSRRSLAWATPAIVVATAAPAHAASPATTLLVAVGQPVRSFDTSLPPRRVQLLVPATITNTGANPTTAFSVVLRVTPSISSIDLGASTATTPMGFADPVRTGNGYQVFFTYLATTQLAAGAAIPFAPTVTLAAETDGAVRVFATPGNGPTAEGGIPFQ